MDATAASTASTTPPSQAATSTTTILESLNRLRAVIKTTNAPTFETPYEMRPIRRQYYEAEERLQSPPTRIPNRTRPVDSNQDDVPCHRLRESPIVIPLPFAVGQSTGRSYSLTAAIQSALHRRPQQTRKLLRIGKVPTENISVRCGDDYDALTQVLGNQTQFNKTYSVSTPADMTGIINHLRHLHYEYQAVMEQIETDVQRGVRLNASQCHNAMKIVANIKRKLSQIDQIQREERESSHTLLTSSLHDNDDSFDMRSETTNSFRRFPLRPQTADKVHSLRVIHSLQ